MLETNYEQTSAKPQRINESDLLKSSRGRKQYFNMVEKADLVSNVDRPQAHGFKNLDTWANITRNVPRWTSYH